MAVKNYQWRASTRYNSTTSLSHGVIPDDSSWHTSTSETGSQTFSYWYRDANVEVGGSYNDANSSRVVVNVTDSWTVSVDNRNYLTVHLVTAINSIVRDDCVGINQDTPGRYIDIYREAGGELVRRFTDTQIATPHDISGSFTLAEHTFTLAPGEGLSKNSLFLHNEVIGISSWDEINMGIEIKNVLPRDYRPGEDWNGSTWMSHNRSGGAANIFNGSGWTEMRTLDGNGVIGGDSPYIFNGSAWANQREIGQE